MSLLPPMFLVHAIRRDPSTTNIEGSMFSILNDIPVAAGGRAR
jgi:hypothetical protein